MLPSTQNFIDQVLADYEVSQPVPDVPKTVIEGAHTRNHTIKDGKAKVGLLMYHHAIHSDLQSVETQCCCCFGRETDQILNGPFVANWFDLLDA